MSDDVEAEVCFQCGMPQSMMIGDEDKPIARFCDEHAAKFMKSNQKRRGALLAFLEGWIEARRRSGDVMREIALSQKEADEWLCSHPEFASAEHVAELQRRRDSGRRLTREEHASGQIRRTASPSGGRRRHLMVARDPSSRCWVLQWANPTATGYSLEAPIERGFLTRGAATDRKKSLCAQAMP